MEEKRAIYPGTFDPITRGHIDIIQRASRIFHRLIVAVAHNPGKKPLFTVEERLDMIHQSLAPLNLPNVEVETFSSLLISYAKEKKATAIIRGLRAVSDFEYEFQMALMNRKLEDTVETIFLMPSEQYTYLSSRIVKEIAYYGGNIECLVTPPVVRMLKEKLMDLGEK
jgi:pantetheine-phosphate adenylyltransferase